MDSLVNLRHLSHLVLLAEELHFIRAASRACLSQSAFSRSIQAIEDQVGLRLFDRGQGEVKLTRVGELVVVSARRLLAIAADLNREFALLRTGELGDLAVGAGPFSGLALMPVVIANLHQAHPRVKVRLEVSESEALLDRLSGDHLDFFVAEIREIPISDELLVERLGLLVGSLYCRPGHPLAGRGGVLSAKDLQGLPFASVPMPLTLARELSDILGLQGALSFALECDSPQILQEFVARSDAILFAISRTVEDAVQSGNLRELVIRELAPEGSPMLLGTELGIVRLRHRTLSPAAEVAIRLLQQRARDVLS